MPNAFRGGRKSWPSYASTWPTTTPSSARDSGRWSTGRRGWRSAARRATARAPASRWSGCCPTWWSWTCRCRAWAGPRRRRLSRSFGAGAESVPRGAPGEPLRLHLAGDAGADERVVAGPPRLHLVPLGLLADRVDLLRLAVERHPVDHPRHHLPRLSH